MKKENKQLIIPKYSYNLGFHPRTLLSKNWDYVARNFFFNINLGSLYYVSNSCITNCNIWYFPYFQFKGLRTQLSTARLFNNLTNNMTNFVQWINIYAPYSRSLIIRGIGYRLYPVVNPTSVDNIQVPQPYLFRRYIYLRAGHSYPTYCFVPNHIGVKTFKKERKLLIYGFTNFIVGMFADRLFYYRPPNAFTGRGIRFKRIKYKRKPGKRAQKGRGF